ncbi:PREDICTED: uncharacterized protein LOC18606045 [Theobroma cacao]|uniref:Uncharacterized protein LOC18606045 n=1 Tax=Theobroma cacao TaxID=3641 RepID=A0AB32VEB7_THECC|nr:PREDICTED: uncharacterized protein LOC18606045 [Theobroma cacao]
MENGRRSYSSMPLASRLDHLDFIMKYLEGKRSLQKGMEKECMPLDLAMREAYFKGSLLDRVTSLEHRLFQLCLELESSSTFSTSTSTSGYASSSLGSRGQPISRSLPTFINSNQAHKQAPHQVLFTRSEIQEESEAMLQKKKDSNPLKQQVGNKRGSKKEKVSKSGKKVSPKWSHWKILGC